MVKTHKNKSAKKRGTKRRSPRRNIRVRSLPPPTRPNATTANVALRFCDDISVAINASWVKSYQMQSLIGSTASTLRLHFAEMKIVSAAFYVIPSAGASANGNAVFVAADFGILPETFKFSTLITTPRACMGKVSSNLSVIWHPTPGEPEAQWQPTASTANCVRLAFMTANCTATNGLENNLKWELITDIRIRFRGLSPAMYKGISMMPTPEEEFEQLDIE